MLVRWLLLGLQTASGWELVARGTNHMIRRLDPSAPSQNSREGSRARNLITNGQWSTMPVENRQKPVYNLTSEDTNHLNRLPFFKQIWEKERKGQANKAHSLIAESPLPKMFKSHQKVCFNFFYKKGIDLLVLPSQSHSSLLPWQFKTVFLRRNLHLLTYTDWGTLY